MNTGFLSLRLPISDLDRLAELSKVTHRPKSFYVKEALSKYLEDLEDVYMAEQSLENVRTGKERMYTSEEVGAMLGLDD